FLRRRAGDASRHVGVVSRGNAARQDHARPLLPRAREERRPRPRRVPHVVGRAHLLQRPEPLGNEFDAAMLARACKGKKTSLKAALSDQKVVAGLGNIYVCEALHRARLSPKRRASTIATKAGAP